MSTLIDTILVTDANHLGFDVGGDHGVFIGVGGEPKTYVCISNGLTYQEATKLANQVESINPHMHINEL